MSDGRRVVWIINHYTTLPSRDGAGARHFRLTQELAPHGWHGVLFLASTKHPSGAQTLARGVRRRVDTEGGTSYVMLRTPAYHGGISRIHNMISFARQLLSRRATRGVARPDVVVGSTVHLLAAWAALRLSRRHGVPFVFEIRDIWPETLIDLGKLKSGSVPARLMAALSKHLCAEAALVISPLPGVRGYLNALGLESTPFEWISNGVDLTQEEHSAGVLSGTGEFTLMYLGSLGHANGVRGLLDAFDLACEGNAQLRLRLVGDGTQRDALQVHASTLRSADRISFENRIARSEVISRAREADALVVNIEDLDVYRFGISLNKLFDYLAAGRPTIIATSAVNNPVAEAAAGLTVPAGDVAALAAAIAEMSETPIADRAQMGVRGVEHARQEYGYSTLAGKLAGRLDDLTADPRPDLPLPRQTVRSTSSSSGEG